MLWPRHFFAAYLVGYLFWLGIVLGSIGLTMLHHLAGGSWGLVIRRPLEAGAATVPLLGFAFRADRLRNAGCFIPGRGPKRPSIWMRHLRAAYLNEPLFLVRAAGYFGVWTALGVPAGRVVEPAGPYRATIGRADDFRRLSGPGTVILFAASTFSAVDWVMSLEAPWASTHLRRDVDHR